VFATTTFEHYQTKTSRIHKLDPRVKLSITLLFILSNVLLPDGDWRVFGLSWIFILAINLLSKISFGFILKRSLIAIPFALAAVTIIFTLPGTPLASFTIGSWDLSISDAGLIRFISILLRSWLSVQAAILLTATTKFPDMAHSLRHLGAPLILITIISFMYRYIFVLSDEAVRLIRARTARSAKKSGHKSPPITWHAKIAGNMIGQLFLRSYEHSDQVYNAMLARGFQGKFLTLTPHKMTNTDWVALFLALGSILLLQLLSHM
jgi:cobalt/nickel transport system permease protein